MRKPSRLFSNRGARQLSRQVSRLAPHGERASGFNYTQQIGGVCADMVARLPELRHIDMGRVAVAICQVRVAAMHGIFASLTPLRFAGGEQTTLRRGQPHAIQRLYGDGGQEMLYILRFYLPRFQNLPLHEKLITILHELWHIGEEFNGDIRRHPGRCHAHSHSQAEYDARMAVLAERWQACSPPNELWEFLREDFGELASRRGPVVGLRISRPRVFPLIQGPEAARAAP